MKHSNLVFKTILLACVRSVVSFAPSTTISSPIPFPHTSKINTSFVNDASTTSRASMFQNKSSLRMKNDIESNNGFFKDITINTLYAVPYLIFFSVATYMTVNEGSSGASQDIINAFIADPLHPNTGSSLFEVVFNTLGLVGLPMACLLMPAANDQKFSATPFLFGSSLAGYGSLGLYMMTRKPREEVSVEDLGWFTKNVLENKTFNWLLVAALLNIYLITGAGQDLFSDFSGTFRTFLDTIEKSALGLTSTVDLTILCLTGASLIPEDLARRGITDKGKAYAIAVSTLLLPAVGTAVYCALRPSLKQE